MCAAEFAPIVDDTLALELYKLHKSRVRTIHRPWNRAHRPASQPSRTTFLPCSSWRGVTVVDEVILVCMTISRPEGFDLSAGLRACPLRCLSRIVWSPAWFHSKYVLCRVNHPQMNGKLERFCGFYEQKRYQFKSIDEYSHWHDEAKPHVSLNIESLETPIQVFHR